MLWLSGHSRIFSRARNSADVVFLGAHRGVGRAARGGDAIERHALDAAAEQLGFLGGEGAGVDAHPGDLRRQPAVLHLPAAVPPHLPALPTPSTPPQTTPPNSRPRPNPSAV